MWRTGHSTSRTSGTGGAAVKLFVTYLQTMTKNCGFWETLSHSSPSKHGELLTHWNDVTSQETCIFFWIIHKTHHGIFWSWRIFRGLGCWQIWWVITVIACYRKTGFKRMFYWRFFWFVTNHVPCIRLVINSKLNFHWLHGYKVFDDINNIGGKGTSFSAKKKTAILCKPQFCTKLLERMFTWCY